MASQAAGLTVTWQSSSPPATFMSVTILASAGEIECFPPDSAGTVTISPSMLSNLPVDRSPGQVLYVARWTMAVRTFGGNTIGLQAVDVVPFGLQIVP
jgi:hypothetical protein